MTTKDEEKTSFTHEELIEITTKTLNELIERDSLLKDLPRGVTLEEVTAQLALQHGQSMTVFVTKENGEELPVVVQVSGKVIDLKKAIQRHVNLKLQRTGDTTKVSWKYIWKANCLMHQGESLFNNEALLASAGIKNKSVCYFKKRTREKNKPFRR